MIKSYPEIQCCPRCGKLDDVGLYRTYWFKKPVYTLRCNGYGCFDSERVYAFSIEKCISKWNKHCDKWKYYNWQCIEK